MLNSPKLAIGIDVGGSSIKGALVDLDSGKFASERFSTPTPAQDSTETLLQALADVVANMPGAHPVIGVALEKIAAERLQREVVAINDADAAAIAEMRYGAARDVPGTVLLLTLGTGIGSALFIDGHLVPNTELGHLQVRGREAELRAAGRIKVEQNLSWDAWVDELNLVLQEMHALLWPDLIVLCGGITDESEKFMGKLRCEARLCVGALRADAGIAGAALATTLAPAALRAQRQS
jgi:polyphosphate glucokinase